jgi:branched-subunit amino acid ABC-type transport system permease component
VGVTLAVLWNYIVDRLWRGNFILGAAILILSLGASSVVSGAVGFSRGPGLRQVEWGMPSLNVFGANLGVPTAYGLFLNLAACIWVQVWSRSKIGFAFNLWAQNQSFASEIGVSRRMLLAGAGICTGILGGVVGAYGALSNGSTPEGGLIMFLYGAGAALLFSKPLVMSGIKGGLLLGALLVMAQLIFSPPIATVLLFSVVTAILFLRGSSRVSQGLR